MGKETIRKTRMNVLNDHPVFTYKAKRDTVGRHIYKATHNLKKKHKLAKNPLKRIYIKRIQTKNNL